MNNHVFTPQVKQTEHQEHIEQIVLHSKIEGKVFTDPSFYWSVHFFPEYLQIRTRLYFLIHIFPKVNIVIIHFRKEGCIGNVHWRWSGCFLSPIHRLFVFLSVCLFIYLSFCNLRGSRLWVFFFGFL